MTAHSRHFVPVKQPSVSRRDEAETHSTRLERLAKEADDLKTGEDLAGLGRQERRKRLFG